MKLDTLIEELIELRNTVGGEVPVVFSFNGCVESGTFLNITEVQSKPYFICKDEGFCLVEDYDLEAEDEPKPMIHLFSNRDHFSP